MSRPFQSLYHSVVHQCPWVKEVFIESSKGNGAIATATILKNSLVLIEHVFQARQRVLNNVIARTESLFNATHPRKSTWTTDMMQQGLLGEEAHNKVRLNCFTSDTCNPEFITMGNQINVFNHSDYPNCAVVYMKTEIKTLFTLPFLVVVTNTDVNPGEELTISYGNQTALDRGFTQARLPDPKYQTDVKQNIEIHDFVHAYCAGPRMADVLQHQFAAHLGLYYLDNNEMYVSTRFNRQYIQRPRDELTRSVIQAAERKMRRSLAPKTSLGQLSFRLAQAHCDACYSVDTPKLCQRCHNIHYCSKECQRRDWPRHKQLCAFF
jgi:hypothetical protein